MVFFLSAQFIIHLTKITFCNGFKIIISYLNLTVVFFFFAHRRKIGTQHIAHIADEVAGHYGIQVNYTKAFAVIIK